MSSQTRPGKRSRLTCLLICDEWTPVLGGISVMNYYLAKSLAVDHRVLCLVPSATPAEFEDAARQGVELVTAVRTPEGPETHVPIPELISARPDVVIGHDSVSGSAAWAYACHYLTRAALVYIVHTPHWQNERHKRPGTATARIESRERVLRQVAADAAVVAAVGPTLARRTRAVVDDGFGSVPVLRLDPGMEVPDGHLRLARKPPPDRTVMMLCRADHIQPKGLDIAARAITRLDVPLGDPPPELLIRGPRADRCDSLHDQLVELSELAPDRIDVRPYTTDRAEIDHDLMRSALLVMPSRAEGFGLAALEAIGRGTPVLVSSNSGLAATLHELLGTAAHPMIVDVTNDKKNVRRWSAAIQRVLDDLPNQFAYAHEIRDQLRHRLSWKATTDALVESVRVALAARSLRVAAAALSGPG